MKGAVRQMIEHFVVGKSVPRLDAFEKVTGKAKYCTDVKIANMLHAKILRSPYAHAKIVSIDTSRANELPGVRAVITGKETPRRRHGGYIFDQHILAHQVVRYVGDPVAAVAGDTREIAEQAIDLIDVKYEELPGVFDVEQAWGTDPPGIVHTGLANYHLGSFETPHCDPSRPNVCAYYRIRHGNVEKGFQEADLVVENEFKVSRIQHCSLEPHICIMRPEVDGGLTMIASRQSIYVAKQYLRTAFDLPPSKVRVIASHYVGGGFGGKMQLTGEPVAALLAMKIGKPVRLEFSREEVFTAGGTRIPMVIYIKDGVKKDGILVAREMRILLNLGAYSGSGALITKNCTFGVVGLYKTPNVKIDSYGIYTNEPPVSPFRGLGSSQTIFAAESQMGILAQKLDMDPVELRLKNLLKEGDVNANGEITHSIGVTNCLYRVTEVLEPHRKSQEDGPWRKGKGVAVGCKYSMAPTASVAIVKVDVDGAIELRHSADEKGQGCNTVLGQIAAEEFGVSMDRIRIVWGDTAITPYFGGGSTSQRTTYELGNAVQRACQDAKKQIFEVASKSLGAEPGALEIKDGEVYIKSDSRRSISLTALFSPDRPLKLGEYGSFIDPGGELLGKAVYMQPYAPANSETGQIDPQDAKKGLRLCAFYGYAAQGFEVAVNVETGEVKVLRIVAAADMGFPINPKMCEQQIEGGVIMGVGSALWEEMRIEKGTVLNANFRDYLLPSTADIPIGKNFQIFLSPSPHKDGPFGAKGLGETQMTPSAPAIANAVYDAIGVRINEIPITREKILKALREKLNKT